LPSWYSGLKDTLLEKYPDSVVIGVNWQKIANTGLSSWEAAQQGETIGSKVTAEILRELGIIPDNIFAHSAATRSVISMSNKLYELTGKKSGTAWIMDGFDGELQFDFSSSFQRTIAIQTSFIGNKWIQDSDLEIILDDSDLLIDENGQNFDSYVIGHGKAPEVVTDFFKGQKVITKDGYEFGLNQLDSELSKRIVYPSLKDEPVRLWTEPGIIGKALIDAGKQAALDVELSNAIGEAARLAALDAIGYSGTQLQLFSPGGAVIQLNTDSILNPQVNSVSFNPDTGVRLSRTLSDKLYLFKQAS
jgi:hypothetical protein